MLYEIRTAKILQGECCERCHRKKGGDNFIGLGANIELEG